MCLLWATGLLENGWQFSRLVWHRRGQNKSASGSARGEFLRCEGSGSCVSWELWILTVATGADVAPFDLWGKMCGNWKTLLFMPFILFLS